MYPRANPFANSAPVPPVPSQFPGQTPQAQQAAPVGGAYGEYGSYGAGAPKFNVPPQYGQPAPPMGAPSPYTQAPPPSAASPAFAQPPVAGGYGAPAPGPQAGYQQGGYAPTVPAPVLGAPPTGGAYRMAAHPDVSGGMVSPGLPHVDASLEASLKESEEFNSPPHFVRGSYSRLPSSARMGTNIRGPMGFVFQPLAAVPAGYQEPPTVNFSTVGSIVRCRRCRTYINPFVQWETSGRRWTCNLCGFSNETLNTHFGPLDTSGRRADRYEHPELCCGSVDYIAPAEYMVRLPQPPAFVFLIDVTAQAVSSGMLDFVCASIKELVAERRLPGGDRCQVGIMTFDTSIHFYNVSGSVKNPQMIVVNEFEEMFVPMGEEVLVPVRENEASILALLDALPRMFRSNKAAESCLGSAVKAAFLAMKHVGGKLLVCASTIPSVGDLGLTSRKDNPRLLNTDREIELLKPTVDGYKDLATELTKVQICCELFVASSMYMDIASIAPLSKLTAGDIRYYPSFNAGVHGEKLRQEMLHVCTRTMGWEAVMRVRVSRGWKIAKVFGHLFVRGADLLVVPNCHQDQTFGITIEPVENEQPDPNICVQFALLYTNSESERRIRVHTVQLVSTPNVAEVYNSLDAEVMGSLMANLAMDEAMRTTVGSGRNSLHTVCQQVASAAGPGNQAVPYLAMYVLGLLKSPLLRATNDVLSDQRVYHWAAFESAPLSVQSALMYPRMFALHNLTGDMGTVNDGRVVLPPQLPVSADQLSHEGVFLVEDGEQMLMWIGTSVAPDVLRGLFGVPSVNQLNVETAEQGIGVSGQVIGQRVAAVLGQLRQDRLPNYMALSVLPHEHPMSHRFFQALVEDRTNGLQTTYAEFLQRLGIAGGAAAPATGSPPLVGGPGPLMPTSYR